MATELTKDDFLKYEEKMKKCIVNLQENLNGIRAGRANPKVLDRISVSYYGTDTPINQIANIQVPEARLIVITPWDLSLLKEIEKSIQASDLGINPNNDGKCLRLNFPPLTEDRRKEHVRQSQKFGEESKIAVRNVRREAVDWIKALLKKKEIGEDIGRDAEDKVQKLTDKYILEIEKLVEMKEKDLMTF